MSAHAPPRHLTQGLLVNEAGVDTDAFVDYADITRRKADSDGLIDNAGGTAGGGASVAPGMVQARLLITWRMPPTTAPITPPHV